MIRAQCGGGPGQGIPESPLTCFNLKVLSKPRKDT